ncbi:hypothetical protein [Endozoicomonas sp. Mp262]|uniref:CAF17-like 4Fe-4S cluster assembly/insertion protein YgfZ n=1 Tax=Endozoicomonas sp. Mp262 TaxID=2919499 RepID=UPI0021DB2D68
MSIEWKTYLASQGATFSKDGQITDFQQQAVLSKEAVVCPLESQAIVAISGPDSQRFLQGQLSCNMETPKPEQWATGVACTPKGRMYSSFTLINTGSGYLLKMHRGIVGTFIQHLEKYAVFYKSKISQPDTPMMCLGLSGTHVTDVLSGQLPILPENQDAMAIDNSFLIKAPGMDNTYELWLPEEHLPQWWTKLTTQLQAAPESYWQRKMIQAVIPQVRPEYNEKYIPQHLNYPSIGYVSFRKGCYTGQEIIARMQNLGQQKSRTYSLVCTGTDNVLPGAKLENGKGQVIGEILESVSSINSNSCHALAVIRIEAAESNDVILTESKTRTIQVSPIPYPIDPRAELQQ